MGFCKRAGECEHGYLWPWVFVNTQVSVSMGTWGPRVFESKHEGECEHRIHW
jgi:hypothetical protein